MAGSNSFWQGIEKIGYGVGGLTGAYYLAASWGTTSSLAGIFCGVAGILVGGVVGAIVGAIALTVAVSLMSIVVNVLADLTSEVINGVSMVFS